MILPNYIVIGAMKSGTTSLRQVLNQHPDVFMTYPNEPRFFYHDQRYQKGVAWYAKWFEEAIDAKAVGEGSGFYSYYSKYPLTAERMYNMLPDTRIIYLVRHPVKRIESHWSWEIASGKALGNINQAIRNHDYFIEQSMYWKQINAYRKYYDDDQIMVLFFEDMIQEPQRFYEKLWSFLEVNDSFLPPTKSVHENSTEGKITDTSLLRKIRYYIPLNTNQLGNLLPNNLKHFVISKLKTTQKASPNWNERDLNYVKDSIKEDMQRFLAYANKHDTYWKL